eukprot:SAG11_NODE_260_length_11531_cov_6.271781_5_plen_42_part_00
MRIFKKIVAHLIATLILSVFFKRFRTGINRYLYSTFGRPSW